MSEVVDAHLYMAAVWIDVTRTIDALVELRQRWNIATARHNENKKRNQAHTRECPKGAWFFTATPMRPQAHDTERFREWHLPRQPRHAHAHHPTSAAPI